jgi:hypothetical protein
MSLEIELGRESESRCGCCGKLSHTLRGFVTRDGDAHAVYMAGYTEGHDEQEGTLLVSIGDWTDSGGHESRTAVCMKVRAIEGRPQVMVVGPSDCPWGDVQVLGAIATREQALARPDIKDYFHVVDHVLVSDERFTRYFA